jgi:putative ABC transport system permease protein
MLPTWLELRIALRTLRRSKAFATFSILALALAITANTTMSSLIDAIVHPDVAFPHPEQLALAAFHGSPWNVTPGSATALPHATLPEALGTSGRTYSAAVPWMNGGPPEEASIQAGDEHLRTRIALVGPHYFGAVGAHPLYGSLFHDSTAADARQVVISEDVWRRLSDNRRAFSPFELVVQWPYGSESFTVVGVLPRNGALPLDAGLYEATRGYEMAALLRLRPGVTRTQALVELNALAPRIDRLHSRVAHFTLERAVVSPATHLDLVAALLASTLAVLLIACANIANLLVARGMARSRELATRLALGASRAQVARLLFAESGIVAFSGGALGNE